MESTATVTKQETVTLPLQELKQLLERIESLEEVVRSLIEGSVEEELFDPVESLRISWQQVQSGETIPIEQLWMASMPNDEQRVLRASKEFQAKLKVLSKKYPHVRSDISPLLEQLQNGETPGVRVQGTGHLIYKARVANRDARRGKSDGYRVVYAIVGDQIIFLVLIYSKTEQTDVSPSVIASVLNENIE